MENIIEELVRKTSTLDMSARISHFVIHVVNQIDLWYINHNFEKDDTYTEMCRDACYMTGIIGMDLQEYVKYNEPSDMQLYGRLILLCSKNLFILICHKLGYDNCSKYGIDPMLSMLNKDALEEFAKCSELNHDKIRDKLMSILGDDSLYGTIHDTVDAVDEEAKQHKFIQALMDEHAKCQ